MNKDFFTFFFISIILLMGALRYSDSVLTSILEFQHNVKHFYQNTRDSLSATIDEHWQQREAIIELQTKLEEYQIDSALFYSMKSEINALYHENKSKKMFQPELELVRVLSYAKYNDMHKLWLDIEDYDPKKVYGLLYDNQSAGIVVNKNGHPQALLNSDPKCSYAVKIGKKGAPGIVNGQNSELMMIEFIPTWMKINVGDEVVTSGLDNLFFPDIKVGVVTEVTQAQGYQQATLKPHINPIRYRYFHMIKKTK
jgi:rod shape-determining protein MreC